MELNKSMRSLLENHSINLTDCIPENTYPIWSKNDAAGREYFGVSSFCGMDKNPIHSDKDLSILEWEGNEVYLSAQSDKEISDILKQAIGIIAFWKKELEAKYPKIPFYIFASYDNGDMLILDEGELPTRSVTLRFWADRGNSTVVNLEDFESWEQPAIVECCNFVAST